MLFLSSLAVCLSITPPAHASWPANGLLVGGGPAAQVSPRLCRDGAGGVLVAWISVRDDTSGDVVLQRIATDGTIQLGWPAAGVHVARAVPSGYRLALADDGAGGAFVLWYGVGVDTAGNYRISHVNAAGLAAPGWSASGARLISATTYEGPNAVLLADGAGGVFAAQMDLQDGYGHVHVEHFRADGSTAAGWPSAGVLVRVGYDEHSDPVLVLDGSGGVWVAWTDNYLYAPERKAHAESYVCALQHVLSSGGLDPALPHAIQVGGYTPYAFYGLAPDASGGVYAIWDGSNVSSSKFGLQAIHRTYDGVNSPGWDSNGYLVSLAGYSISPRSSVPDSRGGFLSAWAQYDFALQQYRIRVQCVRPDHSIPAGWDSAGVEVGRTSSYRCLPQPVSDGLGGATVVWQEDSLDLGLSSKVFAQHVSREGNASPIAGAARRTVTQSAGGPDDPRVLPDGAGGTYVAWSDTRADAGDVYLSRLTLGSLTASAPPPSAITPSVIRVGRPFPNPSSGAVRLSVQLGHASPVSAEVIDIAGRVCRRLPDTLSPSVEPQTLEWDGRDDSGRLMPAALYTLVVHCGRDVATTRVVRVP